MTIENQPEDKQPLLNESEVSSFIPQQPQQQATTAAISHEQATAEIQTENTESKSVESVKVPYLL